MFSGRMEIGKYDQRTYLGRCQRHLCVYKCWNIIMENYVIYVFLLWNHMRQVSVRKCNSYNSGQKRHFSLQQMLSYVECWSHQKQSWAEMSKFWKKKMFAILTTCTPIYCQLEGAMQFSGNFESGNDFHKWGAARGAEVMNKCHIRRIYTPPTHR